MNGAAWTEETDWNKLFTVSKPQFDFDAMGDHVARVCMDLFRPEPAA
jgi:hypothetical protein